MIRRRRRNLDRSGSGRPGPGRSDSDKQTGLLCNTFIRLLDEVLFSTIIQRLLNGVGS